MIVALAGGVGGAKLANGLAQVLAPDELTVVVNTGDDFRHLGLYIAPDLDTVMYTLAGRANPATGWGLAGESWNFMEALGRLGGETWFRLGDRDLATHVERTRRLAGGERLSAVTAALCHAYRVRHRIVPMSDEPVSTIVHTDAGALAFQDYFVRRSCEPAVTSLQYDGAAAARPSAGFLAAMSAESLRGIVVCPSNPYLSIDPILAVAGVRELLATRRVPCVAVSPIIGGSAVKGPAAKIMHELGEVPTAATSARLYADILDGLIVDECDRGLSGEIEARGVRACVAATLMRTAEDQARLARTALAFIASIDRVHRRDPGR
jgi:LPPG:FO 2-phospho-L-lactate transferase